MFKRIEVYIKIKRSKLNHIKNARFSISTNESLEIRSKKRE